MVQKRAFIVSFEGIEACGKSTQFKMLCNFLRKKKIKFLSFSEPGSTKVGKVIRNLLLDPKFKLFPLTEALLFMACRTQLLKEKVIPNLNKAQIILFDRYIDSTLAYQFLSQNTQIDFKTALNLVKKFSFGILPDLTFVLDISLYLSLKRKKDKDRFFKKSLNFHAKVRKAYKELAKIFPKRIVILNALKSREELFKEILEILSKRCNVFMNFNL